MANKKLSSKILSSERQGRPNSKKGTVDYVMKARERHGDRYNYDLFEYVNALTPGIIVCKEHGQFKQRMNDHIRGNGCPQCARNAKKIQSRLKLTTESFIDKALTKHEGLYTYGETVYRDKKTRVLITCRHHGEFKRLPADHLEGRGCPSCEGFRDLVDRGRKMHGDKYQYHIETYKNKNSPVIITCKDHGDFQQVANEHLREGAIYHCPVCRNANNRLRIDEFLRRSKEVHGDRYNYEKTKLGRTASDVVQIYCNFCKQCFEQKPVYHIAGYGCQKCGQMKGGRKVRRVEAGNVSE